MTKLKTVGIYRPTWYRGRGAATSALLTADGQRCCLGFAAKRMGFTDEEMLGKKTPALLLKGVSVEGRQFPGLVTDGSDTVIGSQMMGVNDEQDMDGLGPVDDLNRERALQHCARAAGYRFIFTSSLFVYRLLKLIGRLGF